MFSVVASEGPSSLQMRTGVFSSESAEESVGSGIRIKGRFGCQRPIMVELNMRNRKPGRLEHAVHSWLV